MAVRPPAIMVKSAAKIIKGHILNSEFSWEKQRRRMEMALRSTRVPKSVMLSTETIANLSCEVLRPKAAPSQATLIHIPGGGFTLGTPASARAWSAALSSELLLRTIGPEYSLAPEHQFPAALDEVGLLIDDVINEVGASRVCVSGDSAGANLALVAILQRREKKKPLPAGIILISPWLDLSNDRLGDRGLVARDPLLSPTWLAACAVAYAPGKFEDSLVSPLLGNLQGLPPVLVQGGSDDLLAPDAARFASAVGPETPVTYMVGGGMWHDFAMQVGMLSAADRALEATKEFLMTHLGLEQ